MPEPDKKATVITRLREDVYKELESQCPRPVVNQQTTELMAGFQLGVAHVLEKLRAGFVSASR